MTSIRSRVALVVFLVATAAFAQSGTVTYPGSDVLVTTGDSTTSTFRVINSSSAELFRTDAAGNASFGGGSIVNRFHFFQDADANTFLRLENPNAGANAVPVFQTLSNAASLSIASHGSGRTISRYGITPLAGWNEVLSWMGNGLVVGTSNGAPFILGTANVDRVHITPTGDIGFGITPTYRFQIHDNRDLQSIAAIENPFTSVNANATLMISSDTARFDIKVHSSARTISRFGKVLGGWSEMLDLSPNGAILGTLGATPLVLGTNSTARIEIGGTGDVVVHGKLTADQVVGALYQDVAEWVESEQKLDPGTVVIVAPDRANRVIASTKAYDTRVAGVISSQPGIILGTAGDSKAMVATTGRVRIRVDATAAPIEIGDLLVTSPKRGTAMKSIPVQVGGTEMHRPGTLLGKALEALPAGEGEILVLLSLQ